MSTLQVANLHFSSTGTNRFEYVAPDQINVYVGGTLIFSFTSAGNILPKYTANVGNAVSTSFTVTHNLNSTSPLVSVRENSTQNFVYPDIKYTGVNTILLQFASAPSTNQYAVYVVGG